MSDLFAFARSVLESQPFSRLMGTRLLRFEPGYAELELDLKPEHLQQHGFAHGGVVSYLADNALTFAGGSQLGNVVTAEYKVAYLRPSTGSRLTARASCIYVGKTQATCRCDIYALRDDGQEVLTATALGTITRLGGGASGHA